MNFDSFYDAEMVREMNIWMLVETQASQSDDSNNSILTIPIQLSNYPMILMILN